jgi:hypothetical protein
MTLAFLEAGVPADADLLPHVGHAVMRAYICPMLKEKGNHWLCAVSGRRSQ